MPTTLKRVLPVRSHQGGGHLSPVWTGRAASQVSPGEVGLAPAGIFLEGVPAKAVNVGVQALDGACALSPVDGAYSRRVDDAWKVAEADSW